MKYSLFIALLSNLFALLLSSQHSHFYDFDDRSNNEKHKNLPITKLEKELTKDIEEIAKMMQPSPSTHLKRFPTIRIIRRGPIHIQRFGDLNGPNDLFEESNFLGPEIGSRKIILRKRTNIPPVILGPFRGPIPAAFRINTLPMIPQRSASDSKSDSEDELTKEIAKKMFGPSVFLEKRQDLKPIQKKDSKQESLDQIDEALEKKLEEFVFGNSSPHIKITHNNPAHDHNDSLPKIFKSAIDSSNILKEEAFLPNVISHNLSSSNSSNATYTQQDKEIKKLIKEMDKIEADQQRLKQTPAENHPPKQQAAEPTLHTQHANQSTSRASLTDLEKLEIKELSKNNMTETEGILNFMMKTVNSAEKKNLYISLTILMLLVFIIIIVFCNFLANNKSNRRNNREAKFLDEINNNKFY